MEFDINTILDQLITALSSQLAQLGTAISNILIGVVIVTLICDLIARIALGVTVSRLAEKKGYKRSFLWGFFFKIYALIYVAGLPALCETKSRGDVPQPYTQSAEPAAPTAAPVQGTRAMRHASQDKQI